MKTKLFDSSPAEIPSLSLKDIIHPSSLTRCMAEFQRVIAGEDLEFVEAVFRTKDGREIFVEGNSSCRIVDGKPASTRSIFRDITARRKTEQALRENEERFRQLAEQSKDGFWFLATNPEQVTYISPGVEMIWGLPAERFYQNARVWLKTIHPDDQTRVVEAWNSFVRNPTSRFEIGIPRRPARWIQPLGAGLRHADSQFSGGARSRRRTGPRYQRAQARRGGNPLAQRQLGATRQLTAANAELEVFNRAMVDREQRIIEMKEEVNALCRELRREPKYPPVWEGIP